MKKLLLACMAVLSFAAPALAVDEATTNTRAIIASQYVVGGSTYKCYMSGACDTKPAFKSALATYYSLKIPTKIELSSVKAQLDSANVQIANLISQNSVLTTDKENLTLQITAIQNQLAAANATISALQSQGGSAAQQIATLSSQLNAANVLLADLQTKLSNSNSQVTTLTAQVSALQAQLAAVQAELAQCKITSCVAPPPPPPPPAPLSGVVAEGDSISVYWVGNHVGIFAGSRPDVTVKDFAVGGSGLNNLTTRRQAVLDARPKVFSVLIGANDLTSYASGTAYCNAIISYTAPIKSMGAKIAVGTILPQTQGDATYQAKFASFRNEANACLRLAKGSSIDAVIDYDSVVIPLQPDGVHPTDPGQAVMATVYKPVMNALVDGTPAPPPPAPADTTPPVLSAISTTGITTTAATISWATNEASSTKVEYGLTTGYGSTTTLDPTLVTNHSQTLSGLTSGSVYHYRVSSADASKNNSVSADFTFTTQTSAPPPPAIDPNIPTTGFPSIASNFDINTELVASWGTGAIPASAAPDVVGAFRFICSAGQLLRDDPIVYPGQPGKSHLHQFFGNLLADANSTYDSLRKTGNSSCMSPLNRSGYWIPAMINDKNQVIRPDYVTVYYKRRPLADPLCAKIGKACVDLPRGLRFIFGRNMLDMTAKSTGAGYFDCDGTGAIPGHYKDIPTALAKCPTTARIGAVISAPECWDGKNLDSADHRSHVAYSAYIGQSYAQCPTTHPYVIPTFTLGIWYSQTQGGAQEQLHLSSDAMADGTMMTPGTSFHADWFGAWDDTVKAMWEQNCVDKLLNCSGGDLGNGKQMKMFSGFSWSANPRVVPMPN